MPHRRKSAKSPPWKKHLPPGNFTERSQLETSLPESWKSSTFLLVALLCTGDNTCRGIFFANWLQLTMTLKGNLKTFKLVRRKPTMPRRRESAKSPPWKKHLPPGNFTERSQLETSLPESLKSSTFLLVALLCTGDNTCRGVLFVDWLQLAMTLKGDLKTFKLVRRKPTMPRRRESAESPPWKKAASTGQLHGKVLAGNKFAGKLKIFDLLAGCSSRHKRQHLQRDSFCGLTAIGHGPQRKSEDFPATQKKKTHVPKKGVC